MGVLRDPKLERFAQALARLTAEGMARGAACERAGIEAAYPHTSGKSFAPNCRKRAQRGDVKARVAELLQPAVAKAEQQIEATVEWAIAKLKAIVDYEDAIPKTSDQISAVALIAKLQNWSIAPDRHEHSGPDGTPIATADVSDIERAKALANFIARTKATAQQAA